MRLSLVLLVFLGGYVGGSVFCGLEPILDEAGCGVLMTMEKVEILRWAPKKKG